MGCPLFFHDFVPVANTGPYVRFRCVACNRNFTEKILPDNADPDIEAYTDAYNLKTPDDDWTPSSERKQGKVPFESLEPSNHLQSVLRDLLRPEFEDGEPTGRRECPVKHCSYVSGNLDNLEKHVKAHADKQKKTVYGLLGVEYLNPSRNSDSTEVSQ